jgi:outer membrane immunogenic protein
MKKNVLILLLILAGAFAGNNLMAQENRVGFLIAFASGDIDETGIGAVGEFKIAPKWSIAPQLVFYFPDDGNGADVSFFELNANVNYYFFSQDVFELYGLGGLNFARWKVDYDNNAFEDRSDTEVGLNLGIGSNFDFGKKFVPFAELRFTLGEFDQTVLNLGMKFNLN